jgi:hypothetical protein
MSMRSERVDRGGHEPLAARRVAHVELELDVGLEPVDAPRAAGDAHARLGESVRGGAPDAGGGACDDRRLARDVVGHLVVAISTGCERCAT